MRFPPFTKRTTRRRPRRDKPPAIRTVLLGLLVVTVTGAFCFMLLRLYNGVPTTKYATYYASVPTVGNLLSHDAVRIGGSRVGQVLDRDLGEDGRPRIELQLDPGTRLPADTRVAIRANGLLGARFVELIPGKEREKMLPVGATIKGGASSYTYGLPEAVEVFDEPAREGAQQVVDNLAAGLLDNGARLNTTLEDFRTSPREFVELSDEILSREAAAARLVPSLESTTAALDNVRSSAGEFMQSAGDAVQPFVTEREPTRDAMAIAPAALSAAGDGLQRGRALLTAVRSFATAAEQTLPTAPAGLRQLSALLEEGKAPLADANPTVRDLLPATAESAATALLATEPLGPRLQDGAQLATPFLDYVGEYSCDVINTAVVLRSMTGFGQTGEGVNGPAMAFRLQAVIPAGAEAVGIKDGTGILKREAYEEPCKYVSRPYPQNVPTGVTP